MTKRRDDFDRMIETIRQTASRPDDVTVGVFAEAVQRLHAELAMLEGQVEQIGAAVDKAFDKGATMAAAPTQAPDYSAANKP
jgi:hypothetical protein